MQALEELSIEEIALHPRCSASNCLRMWACTRINNISNRYTLWVSTRIVCLQLETLGYFGLRAVWATASWFASWETAGAVWACTIWRMATSARRALAISFVWWAGRTLACRTMWWASRALAICCLGRKSWHTTTLTIWNFADPSRRSHWRGEREGRGAADHGRDN